MDKYQYRNYNSIIDENEEAMNSMVETNNTNVILYSTGCPRCKVLTKKLNDKSIEFTVNNNTDEMIAMGINELPVLQIEDALLGFKQAVDWINNK